ncbi:MAG: hypothetical protein ABIJ56_15885 [Pseudomonadota bacterium]
MKNHLKKGPLKKNIILPFLAVAFLSLQLHSGEAPAAGKKNKSTFMLLQFEGGFASSPYSHMTGTVGGGILLGAGGKFKGFPLRFYLIGIFDNSRYWHNDSHAQTGESYKLTVNFMEFGGGLRIVLPIVRKLRIYADVLIMGSHQKVELERSGTVFSTAGWTTGAIVAGGLEARWHLHAATGVRVEGNFYQDLKSGIPQIVGVQERGNGRVFVGLTQTFFY